MPGAGLRRGRGHRERLDRRVLVADRVGERHRHGLPDPDVGGARVDGRAVGLLRRQRGHGRLQVRRRPLGRDGVGGDGVGAAEGERLGGGPGGAVGREGPGDDRPGGVRHVHPGDPAAVGVHVHGGGGVDVRGGVDGHARPGRREGGRRGARRRGRGGTRRGGGPAAGTGGGAEHEDGGRREHRRHAPPGRRSVSTRSTAHRTPHRHGRVLAPRRRVRRRRRSHTGPAVPWNGSGCFRRSSA